MPKIVIFDERFHCLGRQLEAPLSGVRHRMQAVGEQDDYVETMCEIMRPLGRTTKAVVAAEAAGTARLHITALELDALRGCDDMEPAVTSWA